MNSLTKFTIAGLLLGSPAFSGGWEASRLDTSMMYNDGGYAEVATTSISYSVSATSGAAVGANTHAMAKDQTRTSFGFKTQFGNFDVGLSSYNSGAIQLDGQATAAGVSLVPSADVTARSLALLGKYRINENMSAFGGLNQYKVQTSTVTTLAATYQVSGDAIAPVVGAAYENKEIALRVEGIIQPKTDMTLTAESAALAFIQAGGSATAVSGSTLVIPQTITLNVQSGIAEDTLLFGSIHKADWDDAQISIPVNATTSAPPIGSSFSSKTAYSVGLGRKISDDLSLIASYSTEDGGGSTSTDPFTLTDGYQTLGVGARYTRDNMTFTAGYAYTKVGDVLVSYDVSAINAALGTLTADYKDNDISAIGLKIGFSF